MLRVTHAILHAFDFEVGEAYLSAGELGLDDRQAKSYVSRHLRRVSASAEGRRAELSHDGTFAAQLQDYLDGREGFVGLSRQVAQWFWEELRRADAVEQADLLVAEFEDTDAVAAGNDAPEPDRFAGDAPRRLAVLVLPRKLSFAHEIDGERNAIYRHDGTIPSPTQKVASWLVVDEGTLAVEFCDRPRLIAGQETNVIGDDLLRARGARPSGRDVFAAVSAIVEEVSEEAGLTPALEVSRAKAALAAAADEGEAVTPAGVGRAVFDGRDDLLERYERAVEEQRLPEEVPVRRAAGRRMAATHSIRTDTGVTITFPSDLPSRGGFLDFTRGEDGRLTITISNVSSIENR